MEKSDNRLQFIDILRSGAILCVVLCHAVEGIYPLNVDYMMSISMESSLFAFSAFTVGRLGVPVFLMLTGYLLLDRDYNDEVCKKFWKKNWLHLFACTEIWFIVYELFIYFYRGTEMTWGRTFEELFLVSNVNMSHVWYLPMILGLYLLIPFVSKALNSFEIKNILFPFIIFCVYAFAVPVLNVILILNGHSQITSLFEMGFSGGTYGLYFVLGFLIRKGIFKKIKSIWLALLSSVSFIAVVYLQMFAFDKGYQYNLWYDCFFVFLCAFGIFELFSRISKVRAYRAIKFISYYSFAVYLIHNLLLEIFLSYFRELPVQLPVQVSLLWISVFVFSLLAAVVIKQIPKIGKFILYLK